MFAARWRTPDHAPFKNGAAAQNWTGVISPNCAHLTQSDIGSAIATRTAGSEKAREIRKRLPADLVRSSAFSSGVASPCSWSRGERSYPAPLTAAMRSPARPASSTATVARSRTKLTPAPATPGWVASVLSTRRAQAAQVIPATSKSSRIALSSPSRAMFPLSTMPSRIPPRGMLTQPRTSGATRVATSSSGAPSPHSSGVSTAWVAPSSASVRRRSATVSGPPTR